MDDPAAGRSSPGAVRPLAATLKGLLAFAAGIVFAMGNGGPADAADRPGVPRPAAPVDPLPKPKSFGESLVLRRCLVFTAQGVRDRQADVEHEDWVMLALENRCPVPVLNLQVELFLVDSQGRSYGKVFWVLGRGERLDAGGRWEDTVGVPDPDNRVPLAWTLRVLRAETPAKTRVAPHPPRDTR